MQVIWLEVPALLEAARRDAANDGNLNKGDADQLYKELTDVRVLLSLAATLPMLQVLQVLIKTLQRRDVYLPDAAAAVDAAVDSLHRLYIDDGTAFRGE